MREIKTEFLFTIALDVPVTSLGDTPYGGRRIARFGTGSFEPGDRHGVSANASKTKPAKLLAVFVVDTNETELTIPFGN
jgi:hypothetical protein